MNNALATELALASEISATRLDALRASGDDRRDTLAWREARDEALEIAVRRELASK